jgi:P27 family predicted phage terminase small subunit
MKVPKIHPVAGPVPPEHLREHGAALWRDITRQYGIGDAAGLALVTMACSAFDRLQEAQAAIDKHGAVVMDHRGTLKRNPACALERDAHSMMLSALRQLHLDIEPLRDRGERSTIFRRT